MQVTVFGATGGIGHTIVSELAARGHTVVAASRSVSAENQPSGVRAVPTDLTDPGQAHAACEGSQVVVMAAQIPYDRWSTELLPLFDAAVDAAASVDARLVAVDNLYAYGSPGRPITESTPETAQTRKGQLRAQLGQRLLQAHQTGRLPVSIGRFADYYGPGGENAVVTQTMIKPALAGKKARTFIDADQPHTFHYLPDAARGFATLVEHREADGKVWILPAAPAVTQRELLTTLEGVLGHDVKAGNISRSMLWLAGIVNSQTRELREVVSQFDRPYVTDASAFTAAFEPIATTPHPKALEETVAWFRASR